MHWRLDSDIDESLPEGVRSEVADVLQQYSNVSSKSDSDLNVDGAIMHNIDTEDAVPIRQTMRRYSPAHLQAIGN